MERKILLEKNGYVLIQLDDVENGEIKYSYGSVEFMDPERELIITGTKNEILKSCKYSVRHCNRKIKKYTRRNQQIVVDWILKQKDALWSFINVLENE